MHKKTIPILAILIILGLFALERAEQPAALSLPSMPAAATSAPSQTDTARIAPAPAHTASGAATPVPAESTDASPARSAPVGPRIAITVATSTYLVAASSSETVLDAMNAARVEGLAFTGRDYPSLGFFVDSIAGKTAADGFNWILYVNGKSADVGVSSAVVKPGDTVEWKYEK